MEKVYMEVPKKNSRTWRSEDVSPYDFRDDIREVTPERRANEPRTTLDNRSVQENYSTPDNRTHQNNRIYLDSQHMNEEDEYDMDAIMEDMDMIEDELENGLYPQRDMYDNGNIDWRCNEDVSQNNMKTMTVDRKTIVEEDNPKRTTTTWMRVRREY